MYVEEWFYSILVDTRFQNPLYESKWKNYYITLHNNNLVVSKWNKTEEDIKHLLFECNIFKNIWQKIEKKPIMFKNHMETYNTWIL